MGLKNILLAQYDLHGALFNNVIVGLSDEESNQTVAGMKNTAKWIAGHMLWDQGILAKIGSVKIEIPWAYHFMSKEGATEDDLKAPACELPTLQIIKDKWQEILPAIRSGLENISGEQLEQTVNMPHPMYRFDNTLAGVWAYANHHHAYSIGQLSIFRRALGKGAMSYASA
ncbi:MAG: DinB superfamily protein [Mucilaginibacter sp.]|nr:DinB superfamily protein [Mucilaginibacter sp.]